MNLNGCRRVRPAGAVLPAAAKPVPSTPASRGVVTRGGPHADAHAADDLTFPILPDGEGERPAELRPFQFLDQPLLRQFVLDLELGLVFDAQAIEAGPGAREADVVAGEIELPPPFFPCEQFEDRLLPVRRLELEPACRSDSC